MEEKLYQELAQITPIEAMQRKENKFHSDFAEKSLINSSQLDSKQLPIFSDEFFKNNQIYVSKHSRFADYPKHTHTFLEINYLLNGQATEFVDGEKIILHAGDVLLLDVGTTHSIRALGQNDLLMNIIFRENAEFSLTNLRNLSSKRDYIFQTLLKNHRFTKFLLYRDKQTEQAIRTVLDQIIGEYFHPQVLSSYLLDSYLNSLLILLARNTNLQSDHSLETTISKPVQKVLQEISINYQIVNLDKIAQAINYNPTYLGNLFKKEIGITFSQALTEQRLLQAYNLLTTSNLTINQIMNQVGLSNRSFFYKKFEAKFGTTPNKIRQAKRQDS